MQIIQNPTVSFRGETAVMLGNFDGFHRAHARLAEHTRAYARRARLTPAAFSFSTPPCKGRQLSTTDEKARLLEKAGIEVLFLFDFDALRTLSPEDFVSRILSDTLRAKAVFCGFNYRFGRDRAGDPACLRSLLPSGVHLEVMPAMFDRDNTLISSSAIRALLEQGDLAAAEQLLGHPLSPTQETP